MCLKKRSSHILIHIYKFLYLATSALVQMIFGNPHKRCLKISHSVFCS